MRFAREDEGSRFRWRGGASRVPRTGVQPLIFAGRSNPALVGRMTAHLDLEPGRVHLETFANGEVYCRYLDSIRGRDVFIVQSGSAPVNPANDHLVELLVMINAARLASASRITAVLPLFPYARQDKKSAPREPISARLVADLLHAAGADRVLTMDLHAGQIEGFMHVPVDHLTALPAFARHCRAQGLSGDDVVVVSPDLGRVKDCRRLAHLLDAELAVVTKERPRHEVAVAVEVIGDVRGKRAVILDDMIVTGNTLVAAAEALLRDGATDARALATHAVLSLDAVETLTRSDCLTAIVVTDTVALELPPDTAVPLIVVTVADLLAEAIQAVCRHRSVSAIFER